MQHARRVQRHEARGACRRPAHAHDAPGAHFGPLLHRRGLRGQVERDAAVARAHQEGLREDGAAGQAPSRGDVPSSGHRPRPHTQRFRSRSRRTCGQNGEVSSETTAAAMCLAAALDTAAWDCASTDSHCLGAGHVPSQEPRNVRRPSLPTSSCDDNATPRAQTLRTSRTHTLQTLDSAVLRSSEPHLRAGPWHALQHPEAVARHGGRRQAARLQRQQPQPHAGRAAQQAHAAAHPHTQVRV